MSNHRRTPPKRVTHTYVIGQPGTGKSRAIESWLMQDVTAGRGVGVIDPHGNLFRNLLYRIAAQTQLWERVVILNPLNPKWTLGVNPLTPLSGSPPERTAGFMVEVGMKVWKLNATGVPRMTRLLSNTFLALAQLGLSMVNLPRFLTDRPWRNQWLDRFPHGGAQEYFRYEFPKTPAAIHQWVAPVLNKIGPFLFDPDIRPMLAGNPTVDFRELMDRKRILLVNLPKGILGEGPASLMAAFIVARLHQELWFDAELL